MNLGAQLYELACCDVVTLNDRTNGCAHMRQVNWTVQLRHWKHSTIFYTNTAAWMTTHQHN